MNDRLLGFIIFAWILFGNNLYGQSGFLGKKHVVFFESSLQVPVKPVLMKQTFDFGPNYSGGYSFERSLLPPRLTVKYGNVYRGHLLISVEGGWLGARNSTFFATTEWKKGQIESFKEDALYKIRTNQFGLNISQRFYAEFAPMGKYLGFKVGLSNAVNAIYSSYSSVYNYNGDRIYVNELWKPFYENTQMINFSFELGRTTFLSGDQLLDFGFRSTLYLGNVNSRFRIKNEPYIPQLNKIFDLIARNNISNVSFFELYVSYGFSK